MTGSTHDQNCGDDRALVSTAHHVLLGAYVAGGVLAVGAAVLFIASPSTRERAAGELRRRAGQRVDERAVLR